MSRPYRGLSVQKVSFELTLTALLGWIIGRNVYRRTEFIMVRNGNAGTLITLGIQTAVASAEALVQAWRQARN